MNFDLVAPHYDWMEAVTAGGLLQRARTSWLDELAGCRRLLSVGEGHGKFAAAFAERFPCTELTCVEASPRMLARARRRLAETRRGAGGSASVRWINAAMPVWAPPAGSFDAIATCFFLDCFPPDDLRDLIANLAAGATREATWLVVDFAVPLSGPMRWRALAMHAVMYGFFRLAAGLPARRLTSPDELLSAQGFQLTARREFSWGLVRADVWRRGTC